ncbi:MAG: hypothetical protein JO273_09290 [Methylobacteriaceae bacterium]|nr:hypothetical protein [Methylobacteriaceae bacterium]
MGEVERIELRLSSRSRLWYRIGAVACLAAGVYGAMAFNDGQGPSTNPSVLQSASVLASLVCGFLLWRIGSRGPGEILLGDEGITLDTNMVLGRVTWDNFQKAGLVRAWEKSGLEAVAKSIGLGRLANQPMLGIAVADPEHFIASKAGLTSRRKLDVNLLALGNRAAMAVMPSQANIAARFLGYSAMPTSGSQTELLAFNRENLGYDILVPLAGVTEVDGIPARIERRRPPGTVPMRAAPRGAPSAAPRPAPAAADAGNAGAPAAGYKICPMCAEPVRAEAKICRFCRHAFEPSAAASS